MLTWAALALASIKHCNGTRFHGDFSQLGGHGHIRGKFKHHFRNARGTLRVNGNPAGLQNCDTGIDDWRAHKTG